MVSVGPVPEPWLGLCKFSVTGSDVPVPAELASVAVNTLSPWLAKVTPADQLPLESTVAVPMAVVPSRIVTIEPASATSTVPAIVWLACETTPPPVVMATVGAPATGGVKVRVIALDVPVPPALLSVAVIVLPP